MFTIHFQIKSIKADATITMDKEEKLVPTPANIEIQESKNSLTIKYKWNKLMGYILVTFSFFWNGIMYFAFISNMIEDNVPSFVLLFTLPFVGVGLFILYMGIANVLNTTTIEVVFDNLNIKHAPMPWRGNRDVFKHDIKQLYVKQHVHRGKNGVSYSYSINMIDRDNKDVKLIDTIQNPEEGKFIEQKIESFLKIQDKRVSGEYL